MNDLQSTSLILSASFSFTSCCFSCVVVFVREKENWQCFRAFCHTTFQHALITCCNVAMYHDRDTFDFSQGRKSVVFSYNVRKNSRYHWAFLTKQLFRSPLLEIIQLSPSGSVNSGGHYASRYIHRP